MELEVLTEDQVTTQKIAEILTRAVIKYEIIEEGDFLVDIEGFRSRLFIEEERKLLVYTLSFVLKVGSKEQRNAYANRLNTNHIFASFCVREDSVAGEYYLPFEGGVLAHQIVHCLRIMHSIVPRAAVHGDSDNLLGRTLGINSLTLDA